MPAELVFIEACAGAIVRLREALTIGNLGELNEANADLRAALLQVQPRLARTGLNGSTMLPKSHLAKIQAEIRIGGELLIRASAANRRALAVFTTEPSSYGPSGL